MLLDFFLVNYYSNLFMEYLHVHGLQLSPLRIKLKAPKATNVSLQSNFVDNLRHFRSQNKLKKAGDLRDRGSADGLHLEMMRRLEDGACGE